MKNAFILCLLLFGMIAVANPTNDVEKQKLVEAKKKAIFYNIRVDLLEKRITIQQAQSRWKKELSKLDKKGAQ